MSALGHPLPKWVKSGHLLSGKAGKYRDKCVFATKQHMFGVLTIVEILNYHRLPIPDPTPNLFVFRNYYLRGTSPLVWLLVQLL